MSEPCRICGNAENNAPYRLKDLMAGSGESFDYFQCAQCGCLQIAHIPDDLARYYPQSYYAFRARRKGAPAPIRGLVDTRRVQHALGRHNLLGALAERVSQPLDYLPWLLPTGLDTEARILDVGCGQGKLLARMALGGFAHLTGIDPFIAEDARPSRHVHLLRRDIHGHAASGMQYDFIMFHHSLEHVPDPRTDLAAACRMLAPGGWILIRIPCVDSWAWEHYREHWWAAEPPRHLYLFSRHALDVLAAEQDLEVRHQASDATRFQCMGSELNRRGIAANAPEAEKNIFTRAQRAEFERRTEQLNRELRGETQVFWLTRPGP
jgi:2-polyprenyl-3-methyl-5-hydroxy-6-metoxy-1,4-benzoquinol methylase